MFWMVSILLAIIAQTKNLMNNNEYSRNFNEPKNSVPEMIRKNWGELEIHHLTTEDGYGLTMFRIPQRMNPKGVILLQPAVTTDSMMWIFAGNGSLAHHLRLRGYDLWLANQRGTEYSQRHINLSTNNFNYWDFTFHEIGYHDMKTQIDFIRKQTNQKVIVIAHSMSTSASLVYMTLRDNEAARSMKLFVNLAPTVYMGHFQSLPRLFQPLTKIFWHLARKFNIPAIKNDHPLIKLMMNLLLNFPDDNMVKILFSLLCGWSYEEIDIDLMKSDMGYHPRSFSLKLLVHYSQLMSSGGFHMYDYGKDENLLKYQNFAPPDYPLENIKVPVFTVYSTDDYMSVVKDVEILLRKIPKSAQLKNVKLSGVNHGDYHLGLHRYERVYQKIFDVLDKI